MKRLLFLFFPILFLAASCSKDNAADLSGQPIPTVTTAAVVEYDDMSAILGGSAADVDPQALTAVGVQYVAWDEKVSSSPNWDNAASLTANPAAIWSVKAKGLSSGISYAVRAYAQTAAGKFFGEAVTFKTDAIEILQPVVTTADVKTFAATTAMLGGSVSTVAPAALTDVGVQYVVWGSAPAAENIDWSKAAEKKTTPDLLWSFDVTGLSADTRYAVRAFVTFNDRRFFGEVKSFTTEPEGRKPLTVAQLRVKHAASADVSAELVRGYVALSVAADCQTESFPAGTVILYDNTGKTASALMLCGTSDNGIGTAGLREGDYVEVALDGAVRNLGVGMIPQYTQIAAARMRVLEHDAVIDPVWATPAQLAAQPADYICAPVKLSRVYAETPGLSFSAADNWFTDGATRVAVYAKSGSLVGQLVQNSATATLCGICSYENKVLVVPVKAADVAGFTTPETPVTGDAKIEVLNTEYYEFAPQGGTLVVDTRITRPTGLRLFADTRFVDTDRYSIDIEGDRVTITARANATGTTADYANCYLYLADSKDGARKATATLRITQLSNAYESMPALIQANGGELSSVHDAVVNDYSTSALKLGSGSYTGHYTTDPTGAVGRKRLVLYAVGWSEGKHEAGTLYLRVEGGGAASVSKIPLTINENATGQAPFVMSVGAESRFEVTLTDLLPGSVISFSTSPTFDKKSDDKTGRALLFGVQICD